VKAAGGIFGLIEKPGKTLMLFGRMGGVPLLHEWVQDIPRGDQVAAGELSRGGKNSFQKRRHSLRGTAES